MSSPTPSSSPSADEIIESHSSPSTIIAASTIVGFLVLATTAFLLFLRITRCLRERREGRRRREARGRLGLGKEEKGGRRRGGRNAFEEREDEGVPVSSGSSKVNRLGLM
jgi:hypothetical protein